MDDCGADIGYARGLYVPEDWQPCMLRNRHALLGHRSVFSATSPGLQPSSVPERLVGLGKCLPRVCRKVLACLIWCPISGSSLQKAMAPLSCSNSMLRMDPQTGNNPSA